MKESNLKSENKRVSLITVFWIVFIILFVILAIWIFLIINKNNKLKEINKIDSSIPIPDGFYFVGGTKKTGFIISDNKSDYKKGVSYKASKKLKGNQFVWVPVDNPTADNEASLKNMADNGKYPMALKTEKGYKGVLYGFYSDEKMYYPILDIMERSEPKVLADKLYGDSEEMLEGSTGNLYQDSYNKMIDSVEKYKGFYISRYEAGNLSVAAKDEGRVLSKSGQTDISNVSWFQMYKAIRSMYNRDDITTEMIWGSQWDATLRWICDNNGNFYNLDSSIGNLTGQKKETGSDEKYSLNHIYDLYGNVSEWTQCAAYDYSRVSMGSNYTNKLSSDTKYIGPTYLYNYIGTRIVLYINN